MTWEPVNSGETIGQLGSEQGVILQDEILPDVSRITLERDGQIAPFSITCGVFGAFMHTAFASTVSEANQKYRAMKAEIEQFPDDDELVGDWIEGFTDKFN